MDSTIVGEHLQAVFDHLDKQTFQTTDKLIAYFCEYQEEVQQELDLWLCRTLKRSHSTPTQACPAPPPPQTPQTEEPRSLRSSKTAVAQATPPPPAKRGRGRPPKVPRVAPQTQATPPTTATRTDGV